jgi:hypothetical protein
LCVGGVIVCCKYCMYVMSCCQNFPGRVRSIMYDELCGVRVCVFNKK